MKQYVRLVRDRNKVKEKSKKSICIYSSENIYRRIFTYIRTSASSPPLLPLPFSSKKEQPATTGSSVDIYIYIYSKIGGRDSKEKGRCVCGKNVNDDDKLR